MYVYNAKEYKCYIFEVSSSVLVRISPWKLLSGKIELLKGLLVYGFGRKYGIEAGGTFNVSEVGFDGTWDDYCDYNRIEEEFADFVDHDVKRLRIYLCRLRNQNQIVYESMPAFVAYKYCASIKSSLDDLYFKLSGKFLLNNYTTIHEDFAEVFFANKKNHACYNASIEVFHEKCMGRQNPCGKMFETLLQIICAESEKSIEDIGQQLAESCEGKYITDDVDWDHIARSIRVMEY